MDVKNIRLQVVSYTDSLFTNAHTLVDVEPAHDGRGTFSHLGVRMDGLESGRHLNFSATKAGENITFTRNASLQNVVVLKVIGGPVTIERVEFDTSFYTKNNVHTVYSMSVTGDDNATAEVQVLCKVQLHGDSKKSVDIDKSFRNIAAHNIVLRLSEGGLARFRAYGRYLPPRSSDHHPTDILHAPGQSITIFGVSDASYGDPSLCFRTDREGAVMAGWESCRHSLRHRFGFKLKQECSRISHVEIDTYMHSLNAFKYVSVFAYIGDCKDDSVIIRGLPNWTISYQRDGKDYSETVRESEMDEMSAKLANDDVLSISYSQESSNNDWHTVLPFVKLERDTLHVFTRTNGLNDINQPINTLFVVGIPDGGIHRIGIYGSVTQDV